MQAPNPTGVRGGYRADHSIKFLYEPPFKVRSGEVDIPDS